MQFAIGSSPHIATPETVSGVMRRVLYGMLPGIVALTWFFGWGLIINILIATAAALVFEAAMLLARGRPLRLFITDYSVIVTAWLLAAALPPLAPWWLTVTGIGFGVIVAKHLYGGLGYNPFNPAMVGYVVLLISFPLEMSLWPMAQSPGSYLLGPLETLNVILSGQLPPGMTLDAITGATPLDAVRTGLTLDRSITDITLNEQFSWLAGVGWEWINIAFLAGGLWLVRTRTADWRIPAGMLGALAAMAGFFWLLDPLSHPSPLLHLFSGATMIGAFFIATDPVSASTTPRGRLIYGAGIGVLVYVIRSFGGYPEGVAFAVLLMNIATPTLDYYTQPRVFGHRRDS